jgi:holo-ACP synthase CitX
LTPCDASRLSLLAARDARQAELERWAGAAGARPPALVALSLAIPGAEKAPPGSPELFAWGEAALSGALPRLRRLYRADDALGPFAVFEAAGEPRVVKERCIAVEGAQPAARLLDLDVYGPGLAPVDRAALGLPPRACLCCGEPARECIRAGRHSFAELAARARELLGSLRAGGQP